MQTRHRPPSSWCNIERVYLKLQSDGMRRLARKRSCPPERQAPDMLQVLPSISVVPHQCDDDRTTPPPRQSRSARTTPCSYTKGSRHLGKLGAHVIRIFTRNANVKRSGALLGDAPTDASGINE